MVILAHGSRLVAKELKAQQILHGQDPAGDCLRPVPMSLKGHPDPLAVAIGIEPELPAIVNFSVRCRKCDNCLRHRTRLWTARGIAECSVSTRTWFGTLTVRPDVRTSRLYAAHLEVSRKRGERWCDLSGDEQYGYVVNALSRDVTLALKRLRKHASFRYLLVSEAHEDGFPHFHVLLHESGQRISKRTLEDHWRIGFSQWRVVETGDSRAAGYVCKYLSKSALTRVRASQRYGQPAVIARLAANVLGPLSEASVKQREGKNIRP